MNESSRAYKWVLLHIHLIHVCHTYMQALVLVGLLAPARCILVRPHIWVSHVAHMNESCRTNERVMSHMWMSYVAHRNESCRTYECVMSHIWMSYVAHMNELCRTYEWAMSHIYLTHKRVTHMQALAILCVLALMQKVWVRPHIWMSHVAHTNESCHPYITHMSVSNTSKHQ